MRIYGRVSQSSSHALDHCVRYRVFEPLGLLMDSVPRVVEKLHQVCLDQAMPPHHPKGGPTTVLGKLDPAIRDMLEKTVLGETLDHPRDRRGGERQKVGDLAGGRGTSFRRKLVDS